jgi:hypothetical protein
LLTLLEKSGFQIPEEIKTIAELTPYAVESRYPGFNEPVNESEYNDAVSSAQKLIQWVESRIKQFRDEEQAKADKNEAPDTNAVDPSPQTSPPSARASDPASE